MCRRTHRQQLSIFTTTIGKVWINTYATNGDEMSYDGVSRWHDPDLYNELDEEIRERCKQIIGTLDAYLPVDLKIGRIKDRINDIVQLIGEE
jgi:hypothetical protein